MSSLQVSGEMMQKPLPIAEIFSSPQGEGLFTGTYMTFVRFAGCTVGRPYKPEDRKAYGLEVYQEKCQSWAGAFFPCDTNYKLSEKFTPEQILRQVGDIPRMCITGGEPLMHDLEELQRAAYAAKKKLHLETSGTIPLDKVRDVGPIWITVSPKFGYLEDALLDANEIKVLVGADFDVRKFERAYGQHIGSGKVWLQPINEEHTITMGNLQLCLEVQRLYPTVRISSQLHKLWGVR